LQLFLKFPASTPVGSTREWLFSPTPERGGPALPGSWCPGSASASFSLLVFSGTQACHAAVAWPTLKGASL